MRKKVAGLSLFLLAVTIYLSYGQEAPPADLKGITLGMNKRELIDSWGYPSKRDVKNKMDVWYYVNENTSHPTDGVTVYFQKGKVKEWKAMDNVYKEMNIWGSDPGTS